MFAHHPNHDSKQGILKCLQKTFKTLDSEQFVRTSAYKQILPTTDEYFLPYGLPL